MKRLPFYLLTAFLIALLTILLLPTFSRHREPGVLRVKVEMSSFAIALRQYEALYNEFPHGESSAIFRALLGSNVRNIVFLNARTNNLGEPLDPWNTPYVIDFTGKTNFVIQSAGKNSKFGDKDDYIYEFAKRDFTQSPKP